MDMEKKPLHNINGGTSCCDCCGRCWGLLWTQFCWSENMKKLGLTLEVEQSVAIKRKKPWPQLNWLGEVGVR